MMFCLVTARDISSSGPCIRAQWTPSACRTLTHRLPHPHRTEQQPPVITRLPAISMEVTEQAPVPQLFTIHITITAATAASTLISIITAKHSLNISIHQPSQPQLLSTISGLPSHPIIHLRSILQILRPHFRPHRTHPPTTRMTILQPHPSIKRTAHTMSRSCSQRESHLKVIASTATNPASLCCPNLSRTRWRVRMARRMA